jgi:uncharacterized protein YndB with AHSA1/START domain
MATESFRISTVIAATPAQIYEAWLDSEQHAAMTGGEATVDGSVGGTFHAWGPYISGTTVELETDRRIVQSWRTNEFPADAPDSRLEVLLSPEAGGTRVSLVHSEIPEGQGDSYRRGWEEFYFQPMKRYFARNAETERPPASDTLPMAPMDGLSEPHPTIHSARPKEERDAERELARAGRPPARRPKRGATKRAGAVKAGATKKKAGATKTARAAKTAAGRKPATRSAKAARAAKASSARKAPAKAKAKAKAKKSSSAKTKPPKRTQARASKAASKPARKKARSSRKR